ncbi:MAG: DegT/DnrJ/EryC1/StrS family aminotransferase [Candidatus Nealsonbacteria bacterium]|nr:DegT/DnrJ/EryC1/StrS family aminotransferase [Candidatus Nealsonbacteria bacterium]
MSYFKPISISLSPNVEKDDLHLALNLIIRPWLWKKGKAIEELENKFKKYLGVKYALSFNSGRSSFFAILKALRGYPLGLEGLKKGDGVALQAFTCNAVPNPVLWADLEPIYVDCNKDDFNIDISDLKAKITLRQAQGGDLTKVLVVQHTFGQPCNMDEIRSVCMAHPNLILIEDCAHSLGAEWKGQKVGTFGKAAFFSFSRDKVISSVYGGMAVTNDDTIGKKLEQLQKEFGQPSRFWILQQILHPILLGYIILPIYSFLDLGKIFLVLSQWLHILSKAVSWQEKRGERPDYFPRALPNALAVMASNQFNKLEKFNQHRQKIADYYYENLKNTEFQLPKKFDNRKNIFLRFTVKQKYPKGTPAHEIIYNAWHKQNILLGDWYTTPIAPFDTKIEEIKYASGSCKNAEELSEITLNLPTHINISRKDTERIVNFLKKFN